MRKSVRYTVKFVKRCIDRWAHYRSAYMAPNPSASRGWCHRKRAGALPCGRIVPWIQGYQSIRRHCTLPQAWRARLPCTYHFSCSCEEDKPSCCVRAKKNRHHGRNRLPLTNFYRLAGRRPRRRIYREPDRNSSSGHDTPRPGPRDRRARPPRPGLRARELP